MKNQILLFLLSFRPWQIENTNDDYWGRQRRGFKTLFGRKYWSPVVENPDLLFEPESRFKGYSNKGFNSKKTNKPRPYLAKTKG